MSRLSFVICTLGACLFAYTTVADEPLDRATLDAWFASYRG
jgi:hypothetical protein